MKKILSVIVTVIVLVVLALSFAACGSAGTVQIKYYSNGSEMLPMLKQGKISYGILPEPAATQITKIAPDKTWYRLDMQELYDKGEKAYPQAVLLIKESLLATHPEVVTAFSEGVDAGVSWAKNNLSEAVLAINSNLEAGVTPSFSTGNLTANVIDGCKVYYESAAAAKQSVKNYIDRIIEVADEATVPAVKPADDFFFDTTETLAGSYSGDTIKVFCPDGAPALALAKLINDKSDLNTGLNVEYNIVSATSIGSKAGLADILILPVNAATKIYNRGASAYKTVAIVTHGNLYLVSTERVEIKDLKDKVVGVIGQGLVPDLTFKAILKANNMESVIAG